MYSAAPSHQSATVPTSMEHAASHVSPRYIEFTSAADIVLLIGDIIAISVIAFVILSSPIRYFMRKRRCCVNVACCKKEEAQDEEETVRRVESVIKCAVFVFHRALQ
jgi:hypothetical protein